MKFKVKKDSPTGWALVDLIVKMRHADKAQREFVQAHGYPTDIAVSTTRVAGGLLGILFAEKPADWKLSYETGGKKYYYPVANRLSVRAIRKEMEALPEVSIFEFNRAIKWDGFLCAYGLADRKPYFLLDVPELKDVALPAAPGLEEITSAEYERLLAEKPTPAATPTIQEGASHAL
jgi:hypothetical protein